MTGSDQGMFNSYAAISAYWSDTTAMDNIRAADITDSTVAGSLETIGANTAANNVRGGHSVHTVQLYDQYYKRESTHPVTRHENGTFCIDEQERDELAIQVSGR